MLATPGTATAVGEISELLITTNTAGDLARIAVGKYLILSDIFGVFKVEELLPGCTSDGCGYRRFRARRVGVDLESVRSYLNEGNSMEYLEKGQSMICWEPYTEDRPLFNNLNFIVTATK